MGKNLPTRISVVVATVGLAVLAAVPSGAQTPTTEPPTTAALAACLVSISPSPAPVGSFPLMTVSGFLPNESIDLVALGLGGTYQADDAGVWTITFGQPVPADLAGQVFDYFWTGQESGVTCSASLAFVAVTATTAPPAETGAVTARPGFTG